MTRSETDRAHHDVLDELGKYVSARAVRAAGTHATREQIHAHVAACKAQVKRYGDAGFEDAAGFIAAFAGNG